MWIIKTKSIFSENNEKEIKLQLQQYQQHQAANINKDENKNAAWYLTNLMNLLFINTMHLSGAYVWVLFCLKSMQLFSMDDVVGNASGKICCHEIQTKIIW